MLMVSKVEEKMLESIPERWQSVMHRMEEINHELRSTDIRLLHNPTDEQLHHSGRKPFVQRDRRQRYRGFHRQFSHPAELHQQLPRGLPGAGCIGDVCMACTAQADRQGKGRPVLRDLGVRLIDTREGSHRSPPVWFSP